MPAAPRSEPPTHPPAPRVLLAHGEQAVRYRLKRVLSRHGYLVETVSDANGLLEAAREHRAQIVLVEAALAERGGAFLLRQLRGDPASRGLPVILLAEHAGEASLSAHPAQAADDCLIRPFGGRDVVSRVASRLTIAQARREAAETVKTAERRLSDVLEAIGEAVFEMDRDDRLLFVNRRALELWGRRAEEVVGRRILDAFPGIEAGEPYQIYCRVRATQRPVRVETTAPAMGGRWIGLDVYPAPEGGLVVAFRDIDKRRRAEAALRHSEERFRMMLEALPQIAFVIRADGMAEYYNRQLREYVGAPIGPDPDARTALHHPNDQGRVEEARREGMRTDREYVIEARMRRHDGVYRWHRLHNRPIRLGGETVYWLGTAADINDMREANELLEQRVAERTAELEAANRRLAAQIEEREKAEAQLRQAQRIEAVGQLTSGVAHDFNNLLTAVIGNLEMLAAWLGAPDGRAAQLLSGAQDAAERGARLTAQLLAFSRQQRMAPERVDLNEIVAVASALLESTIGATMGIETALSDALWPAFADPNQIELVLLNLAINARDAMPAGGVITIATANVTRGRPERPEEPPPGDFVMVSVADTGNGIPPDILDRVFEPFFTTKEVGKGSGLGLSQVLGVAQQMGGGVRILTRPGEGTVVEVYLPRALLSEAEDRQSRREAAAAEEQASRRTGTILLVDDDSDVRAVAAAMLRQAGHRVVEAGSGGAALEQLARASRAIDLLVADFAMPGMNGVELARAARHDRPGLPVIFVTGFADTAVLTEGARPDEILQKPFRTADLCSRVAKALAQTAGG